MSNKLITLAYNTNLAGVPKAVLVFLANSQNEEKGDVSWHSLDSMIYYTGFARSTIQNSIKQLEKLGIVFKKQRFNNSNIYRVLESGLLAHQKVRTRLGDMEEDQWGTGDTPPSAGDTPPRTGDTPPGTGEIPEEVQEVGAKPNPNSIKPNTNEDADSDVDSDTQELVVEIVKLLHASDIDVSVKNKEIRDLIECGAELDLFDLFKQGVSVCVEKQIFDLSYLIGVVKNKMKRSSAQTQLSKPTRPTLTVVQSNTTPVVDLAGNKESQDLERFKRFQAFSLATIVLNRPDADELLKFAESRRQGLEQYALLTAKTARQATSYGYWSKFQKWSSKHRPDLIANALVEPHHKDFDAWLEWTYGGQKNIKACG